MIHNYFYYFGAIVNLLAGAILAAMFLCFLYEKGINKLAEVFKNMWVILEYQFYRKEFKEWIKTKKKTD